jgi:hypothetical protein
VKEAASEVARNCEICSMSSRGRFRRNDLSKALGLSSGAKEEMARRSEERWSSTPILMIRYMAPEKVKLII